MRQGDYKYVFSEQRWQARWGSGPSRSPRCACRRSSTSIQDPFERADITSNTFWDWQINHVGSMYGVMDDVFKFAATFKEYPPRSIPPSFNPANDHGRDPANDQSQAEAGDGLSDAQRRRCGRECEAKGVSSETIRRAKNEESNWLTAPDDTTSAS